MKLPSIFGMRGARDKPKDSYGGQAYSFFFGRSTSGKNVNERTAMQTTAVYSCVRILAEAVASLPIHVYRYTDTGKERVYDHPLYYTLVEALEEENCFRSLATVIQTSSGDRKIPVVASKGEASWIDEEGAYPESDDSFGQVSIGAFKVATMIKVSDELLNDNVFNLEAYISQEFGRRIGTKEEEAFFIGDGKGKPTGILNAAGGASDGVTTATANITFDDVMDLFYSLKAPYRKKAVWLLNDTTVKALRKLKDNNGNYIWQPSVQAGVPDMILNRPYHTSSYVPEVSAGSKVMAFGDFSYYWIADRQGRSFKRLNELFAATGQVGFLASQRVDGKLILAEAVKTMTVKKTASAAS